MRLLVAAAVVFLDAAPLFAQQALLRLDHLTRLASQARESVDVTLDASMLQMAAGLLPADKTNDASIKSVIQNLKGIYVKTFEFDREGAYTSEDVEAVRSQLKAPWTRIVNIDSQQDRERVEVYVWRENDQPGGLAVLVAEPKELTVVNIVGRIDLSQLSGLSGVLGIPQAIGGVAPPGVKKP